MPLRAQTLAVMSSCVCKLNDTVMYLCAFSIGLCIEDTRRTVCSQKRYPAIVLTKGGSGDLGGCDKAEDYDKNKDRTCDAPV